MTSSPSHPLTTDGSSIPSPSTPILQSAFLPTHPTPTSVAHQESLQSSRIDKTSHVSPAPPSSSEMTPPPSSQLPSQSASVIHNEVAKTSLLASPPATLKPGAPLHGFEASGSYSNLPLPSAQQIANASEGELRNIINELLPALSEARMSSAHHKLQHQLLSIETSESAMRAAVEHEMTRREIDVLQKPEHQRSDTFYSLLRQHPPNVPSSSLVEIALQKRCEQLEKINSGLVTRFRRAKKVILYQESKNVDLTEDCQRLRQRIRENREHITQIRSSGGLFMASATPNELMVPHHKPTSRYSHNARTSATARNAGTNRQDPFAALLAADQVLNGESVSVPSTPIRNHASKFHLGHTRGTHSLSSLPTTPARSRAATADSPLFTPINKITLGGAYSHSAPQTHVARVNQEQRREDRDSTISASENEDEAYTDEDVPQSQASQAATHMLRRSPTRRVEMVGSPAKAHNSSTLRQGKLFGQVKKAGVVRYPDSRKRKLIENDVDRDMIEAKRSRMSEGVGLGIGHWGSPVA
ncbi:hypothetical protein MMC16_000473 [Acarospora aff. strigata]|nr:hypothetical protein [Acarospora aff. strigata]